MHFGASPTARVGPTCWLTRGVHCGVVCLPVWDLSRSAQTWPGTQVSWSRVKRRCVCKCFSSVCQSVRVYQAQYEPVRC